MRNTVETYCPGLLYRGGGGRGTGILHPFFCPGIGCRSSKLRLQRASWRCWWAYLSDLHSTTQLHGWPRCTNGGRRQSKNHSKTTQIYWLQPISPPCAIYVIYIWHLSLTVISYNYLWQLDVTFISDIYVWYLYMTCISVNSKVYWSTHRSPNPLFNSCKFSANKMTPKQKCNKAPFAAFFFGTLGPNEDRRILWILAAPVVATSGKSAGILMEVQKCIDLHMGRQTLYFTVANVRQS